jgi:hypothetical protein
MRCMVAYRVGAVGACYYATMQMSDREEQGGCGGAVVRWMTCTFTQSRDSCLALADDASSQVDAAWRTFEQGFKV